MEIIKGHSLIFHHFFFQTSGDFGITCKLFFFQILQMKNITKKQNKTKQNKSDHVHLIGFLQNKYCTWELKKKRGCHDSWVYVMGIEML